MEKEKTKMADNTSTSSSASASLTADTLIKTLADIALEKLKDDAKGFYTFDFLLPSLDKPTLQAEAGIKLSDLFKVSLWSQYDIAAGTILGGIRIGGEIKL